MYRTVEHPKQNYASSSTTNEKLKQKKRLSFREPEVEAAHNSNCSNSNRIQSKQSALLALSSDELKHSASLEDLTLEDQTFIIAKNVGQAFDKRPYGRMPINITAATGCSDPVSIRSNGVFPRETLQKDCSHIGSAIQKNGSNSRFAFSSEDVRYFEALSPPVLNMTTMKFPAVEASESSIPKPNQALVASTDMISTSVQHQLQFLKYQLEQQRQQTQAALAHIQLLKDQLQAETSARFKAQTQNHQLIMQNKELLDHIQRLFQQIQDLENLTNEQERKPTFPSPTTPSTISSSSQESQETRIKSEVMTVKAVPVQKNNSEGQLAKTSTFAPNTTMANRRSSLTSLKPFPKTNNLEQNSRLDDVKLNSRGSSPSPAYQIRSPPLSPAVETANNLHTGRSFLFNNTQKSDGNKDVSVKERNSNALKERQYSTKTNEDIQISSIPVYNTTAKHTTKTSLKSSNSDLTLRNENLFINENPFIIEEKSPRKADAYSSRKNHSSDQLPAYSGSKISSVALNPKPSYAGGGWSKSSKLQNIDSVLPLTLDSTANLCVKENKRFLSGNSKLFNS